MRLKGLPESILPMPRKNDKGNYLLGFDYPAYQPFMELSESDAARKNVTRLLLPDRGTAKNLDLLKQIIDLVMNRHSYLVSQAMPISP